MSPGVSAGILYGLCISAGLRLILMFGRERVPDSQPVVLEGGEAVLAHVGRGKYRRVDSLAVAFDAPRGWRFNLRREGPFDRFAKWIGMANEFQTRDAPFDGRIYIECDDALLHQKLSHRLLRNQIFSLFGFDSVKSMTCVDGWLWFTLKTDDVDKKLADEQIGRQSATPLQAGVRVLREEMKAPVVSDETARDPTRLTRRVFAYAMLALGVTGGTAAFWQLGHEDHQVVVEGTFRIAAWATSCVTAALLLTMVATLGGTARAQRVFLDILFAGIPAAWLASFGGSMYLNESLDPSLVRRVPVPIARAWEEAGRKHSHYYLAAARWPDARGKPLVELKRDEYQVMQSGTCIDVLWRGGWLGDGWIEGYQPHKSVSCDEGVEQ